MILVVASSTLELQGIEQLPPSTDELRTLPSGTSIVAVAVGIGKINAALGTAQAIRKWSPTLVIGVGTCGAIRQDLQIGDIVLPSKVVQYDIDLRLFGWPRGSIQTVEGNLEGTLDIDMLPISLHHWNEKKIISSLIVGTADTFSLVGERAKQPWISEELGIDVVDMESYAFVKAAKQADCKVAIVRVVSDTWRGNRPKRYKKFLSEGSFDIFSLIAQYADPSEKSPTIL